MTETQHRTACTLMASCLRVARTAADQPRNALVTRACCVRLTARPSNRLRVRLSASHVRHVDARKETFRGLLRHGEARGPSRAAELDRRYRGRVFGVAFKSF